MGNEPVGFVQASVPQHVGLLSLLEMWADEALRFAVTEQMDDPPGVFASVPGLEGAWGCAPDKEEALADLRSTLVEWARLVLQDADQDLPVMGGVHLVAQ